jgi:hypothetical protein
MHVDTIQPREHMRAQNIFLIWGLLCGGAALIVASLTLAVVAARMKCAGDSGQAAQGRSGAANRDEYR